MNSANSLLANCRPLLLMRTFIIPCVEIMRFIDLTVSVVDSLQGTDFDVVGVIVSCCKISYAPLTQTCLHPFYSKA